MPPGHSLQTGFVRSDTGVPQQANLDSSGNVQVNLVSGGGTGGGPATVADGADVAEGSTSDAAWVSGAGTVISLLKKIASGGGGSAVSIADGSDVAEGTTTDAAIVSDTSGTVIGFLRGLVKMFASVWDSVNGRLKVDGSGVTQPISGTVTAATVGTSASATLLNLNDEVRIALGNNAGASFSIASTIVSGTLIVEGSLNGGATWHNVRAIRKATGAWASNAIGFSGSTAGTNWEILPAYSGTTDIRVRVFSATTPANVVTLFTGQAAYLPTLLEGVTGTTPAGLDQMFRIGGTAANGITDQIATFGSGLGSPSLRVNLATDVSLPAGTNAIGKLGSNSGVVIGDVRIVNTNVAAVKAASTAASDADPALVVRSIQLPTAVGQAAMAASLPVVIASNQTAVPVSGTVAVSSISGTPFVNVQQIAGNIANVNSGPVDIGTLRVVIATDQPALTNKLLVTPDSVALPANQSVNVSQFGGNNTVTGTGASGVGIPRVTVANDSAVIVSGTVTAIDAVPTHIGRASTFRIPGRAGSAGQKILSLHNASGSAVTVKVTKVVVDLACTVVKLITVLPPIIRLWKVTVLPTNGTAMTKVKIGGSGASSASVTVLNDASSDGNSSASALTATLPSGAIITQEFAPRFISAAGYEMADRVEFLGDSEVTLGALEGVVLFLDYGAAGQNPITDMWVASVEWTEN